jgi:hypothetical protein
MTYNRYEGQCHLKIGFGGTLAQPKKRRLYTKLWQFVLLSGVFSKNYQ